MRLVLLLLLPALLAGPALTASSAVPGSVASCPVDTAVASASALEVVASG